MRYCLLAALLMGLTLPGSATSAKDIVMKEEGIVTIPSNHSVEETVDKLKNILQSKGVTLFAVIDHSGEAAKVGMKSSWAKISL